MRAKLVPSTIFCECGHIMQFDDANNLTCFNSKCDLRGRTWKLSFALTEVFTAKPEEPRP